MSAVTISNTAPLPIPAYTGNSAATSLKSILRKPRSSHVEVIEEDFSHLRIENLEIEPQTKIRFDPTVKVIDYSFKWDKQIISKILLKSHRAFEEYKSQKRVLKIHLTDLRNSFRELTISCILFGYQLSTLQNKPSIYKEIRKKLFKSFEPYLSDKLNPNKPDEYLLKLKNVLAPLFEELQEKSGRKWNLNFYEEFLNNDQNDSILDLRHHLENRIKHIASALQWFGHAECRQVTPGTSLSNDPTGLLIANEFFHYIKSISKVKPLTAKYIEDFHDAVQETGTQESVRFFAKHVYQKIVLPNQCQVTKACRSFFEEYLPFLGRYLTNIVIPKWMSPPPLPQLSMDCTQEQVNQYQKSKEIASLLYRFYHLFSISSNNQISKIHLRTTETSESFLSQLSKLRVLKFDLYEPLTTQFLTWLANLCPNIEELTFFCRFECTEGVKWPTYPDHLIFTFPKLKKLKLMGSIIIRVETIQSLMNIKTFESLTIHSNAFIGDEILSSMSLLSHQIKKMSFINCSNLTGQPLIEHHFPLLESLNLINCPLVSTKVLKFIKDQPKLSKVKLPSFCDGDGDFSLLVKAPALEKLYLDINWTLSFPYFKALFTIPKLNELWLPRHGVPYIHDIHDSTEAVEIWKLIKAKGITLHLYHSPHSPPYFAKVSR